MRRERRRAPKPGSSDGPDSRYSMPFSRYFGTLQLANGHRQVRQIVQSQLNLDDFIAVIPILAESICNLERWSGRSSTGVKADSGSEWRWAIRTSEEAQAIERGAGATYRRGMEGSEERAEVAERTGGGHPYSLRSPYRSLETPELRGAGAGDLRRAGLRGAAAGLGEGKPVSGDFAVPVARYAAAPWTGTQQTGAFGAAADQPVQLHDRKRKPRGASAVPTRTAKGFAGCGIEVIDRRMRAANLPRNRG